MLFAFDLLYLDGEDLRSKPLEQRRARLQELLTAAIQSCIAFSDGFEGEGADIFRAAEAAGLEGLVSKRLGSRYCSGARVGWLKTKAFTCSTFDVIGIERSETGAPVALLAEAGHYVGNAFVTLPRGLREAFWQYVEDNAADASSVKGMRRVPRQGSSRACKPRLGTCAARRRCGMRFCRPCTSRLRHIVLSLFQALHNSEIPGSCSP